MNREERLAAFERMLAAYHHNHNRMARIGHELRARAEAITLRDRPKRRQYGRNKATWTGADEDYYLARFFELKAERGTEIKTLTRKIKRQAVAINAQFTKLRLNDPPDLPTCPIIHPGVFIDK